MHSVSVSAVIFDDSGQNVLLIRRRDNGEWQPPGGVLELDETIEEGLRREVLEETGVEIRVGELSGIYKNMPLAVIALVFNAKALTNHRAQSEEAEEVAWMPIEGVERLMRPPFAARIADAISGAPPKTHWHDGNLFANGGNR